MYSTISIQHLSLKSILRHYLTPADTPPTIDKFIHGNAAMYQPTILHSGQSKTESNGEPPRIFFTAVHRIYLCLYFFEAGKFRASRGSDNRWGEKQ